MAGPFCTMLLADLGADVIKIEPPRGDSTRQMPGPGGGESPSYWALNRKKRGIAINLKHQAGVEIMRKVTVPATGFVWTFLPAGMACLGLDIPQLARRNGGCS